jgi:ethanolamine utilization protein EutA (predicted chaperonin)
MKEQCTQCQNTKCLDLYIGGRLIVTNAETENQNIEYMNQEVKDCPIKKFFDLRDRLKYNGRYIKLK